jgi:RES domain-containing protein
MIEGAQGFSGKFKPYTMVSYDVDSADIADLCDEQERLALGIALADLGCAWFALATMGTPPPSWLLAEKLIQQGYAGAIYPSFAQAADATRHHNLVLWDWSDQPPHQVVVHDPDLRLPRNQSSWT